jgi:amino acid permease
LDHTPQDRESKVAMMLKYFGIIMAIFYFTMGAGVLFLPLFGGIDTTIRYIFAAMLIIYGAFRLYRIFKK